MSVGMTLSVFTVLAGTFSGSVSNRPSGPDRRDVPQVTAVSYRVDDHRDNDDRRVIDDRRDTDDRRDFDDRRVEVQRHDVDDHRDDRRDVNVRHDDHQDRGDGHIAGHDRG